MALFAAAAELTGDQQIARRVGEETVAQHAGTPVATLMRSLGSPEAIYGAMTQAGSKFTTVSVLEALEVAPGRAVIREYAAPGFVRTVHHCDWAKGLLSQPTCLFGLPPAIVEESTCQARGDEGCVYEITWDASMADKTSDPAEHVTVLEAQLGAMTERLDSLYATATDLIADTELDSVLARITERAATAVRAPRYLLALRSEEDSGIHCHYSGFEEEEAIELADRLLDSPDEAAQHLARRGGQLPPALVRTPRGDGRTPASSRRSATCSSCTPATRPPRSTAPPHWTRRIAVTRRPAPCWSSPARSPRPPPATR